MTFPAVVDYYSLTFYYRKEKQLFKPWFYETIFWNNIWF